ncbi:MAG: hypothetical protein KF900_07280 [Bacteroidetes bacterium]|nr:hypothetical protein [Bacteroidota bacterium]
MRKNIIGLLFLVLAFAGKGQVVCETPFVSDTMTCLKDHKTLEGEYVETTLKNQTVVRLYRAKGGKLFLRFIITKNFYFDREGTLEIVSGKKSYYEHDCRQYKISKTSGMYMLEIQKNYLATLKEYGITALVFNNAETKFTKQDAAQIKKMAKCVYDTYFETKK